MPSSSHKQTDKMKRETTKPSTAKEDLNCILKDRRREKGGEGVDIVLAQRGMLTRLYTRVILYSIVECEWLGGDTPV
jgi:hypothetical protein